MFFLVANLILSESNLCPFVRVWSAVEMGASCFFINYDYYPFYDGRFSKSFRYMSHFLFFNLNHMQSVFSPNTSYFLTLTVALVSLTFSKLLLSVQGRLGVASELCHTIQLHFSDHRNARHLFIHYVGMSSSDLCWLIGLGLKSRTNAQFKQM